MRGIHQTGSHTGPAPAASNRRRSPYDRRHGSRRGRRRQRGRQHAATCGRCPRRTCTCTSPAPCGTTTLLELAERDGIALPDSLVEDWPPAAVGGRREGLVPLPAPLRRRAVGAAHPRRRTPTGARGRRGRRRRRRAAGWRSRSTRAGTPPGSAASPPSPTWCSTACATPAERTGLPMAVVVAANRTRHPLDARTLARLAAQYAGRGVVGFGLSNDERRGTTADFAPAFAIAERAGLLLAPHGGELRGPEHIRTCLDELHADRLGHGVRAAEDPALLDRIVEAGVALEVCPVSNVALGVYSDLTSVPLPPADGRRGDDRARAPTTRCSSAPGWPGSTPRCGPPTSSPTPTWRRWPGRRSRPPAPPTTCAAAPWPRSTRGSPVRTDLRDLARLGGCPREQPGPARPAAGPRAPSRGRPHTNPDGSQTPQYPGQGSEPSTHPYGSADTSSYGTPPTHTPYGGPPAPPTQPYAAQPPLRAGPVHAALRPGPVRPAPAPTASQPGQYGGYGQPGHARRPSAPLGHHRDGAGPRCRSSGCSCAWSRS